MSRERYAECPNHVDIVNIVKLSAELTDLTAIFETKYRFKVVPAVIKTEKPVLELTCYISKFLLEHNDRNGLLLIYYAGHGQSLLNQECVSGGNGRQLGDIQLIRYA
jgi:hypothetical protein